MTASYSLNYNLLNFIFFMNYIIENQLFPCIDFIKILVKAKHIRIDAYEHFQKMSFRNRFIIAGANGLVNLTIPVAGGREQRTLITDIEINANTNWAIKHWRSISSAYSKAPFFDFYADEIKTMLFNEDKNLFNFNCFIINKISKLLTINCHIDFTDEYIMPNLALAKGEIDYRNTLLPRNFQVNRENWRPKYSQVFEERLGFQPNLSILDLLFCEGPNSINLLEKSVFL